MDIDATMKNLNERLDALKRQISEKTEETGRSGPLPPHLQARIGDIGSRTDAARQKIRSTASSRPGGVKDELESEWQALTHDFELWLKHVDEHYRD